ncbi:hypothetical protein FDP41_010970 [Naegleria fowleri]|uniref:Uncharacterized protein n=1 Tax=Naegleria fowleri TaxID=5763 RepID=A0A6A5C7V9_NAEFO|nr:uncharacterized protein FDP41_010970 [Naegleria fowleri]KAF0982992.1 hypothetical protein FDP41_010970 [Naegleria fowleri]CAG4715030.1 unnamed protein product [Naegleria fowleri]
MSSSSSSTLDPSLSITQQYPLGTSSPKLGHHSSTRQLNAPSTSSSYQVPHPMKQQLYQAVVNGQVDRVESILDELLDYAQQQYNTNSISNGGLQSPTLSTMAPLFANTSPIPNSNIISPSNHHVSSPLPGTSNTSNGSSHLNGNHHIGHHPQDEEEDVAVESQPNTTSNTPQLHQSSTSQCNSVSSSCSSLLGSSPPGSLSASSNTPNLNNSNSLSSSRGAIGGPSIDQIILKTTYPEEFDINIVHLAAKSNQAECLSHIISKACCDEKCGAGLHSADCQRKTNVILSSVDKQNATPLFYGIQAGSPTICTYLCSFKIVQDQLNMHADRYGFLPIHIALKRKDFDMCDTLQLFGAKLETTVGMGVGLGESVLHVAVRDKSIETVEYLAKTKPGILLKKNQQEENALFACLTDFRGMRTKKLVTSFLSTLLPTGSSLFGADAFERAILQKNAHGRNVLMESIAKNDMSSLYAILEYLQNEKNSTKNRLIPILLNEVDSQQKNILHLCVQSVFSTGMAFDPDTDEASLDWMNALYWIYDFVENCGVVKVSKMSSLFLAKDKYGDTPKESCKQFYDSTNNDLQEPLIISETIGESLDETQNYWIAGKKRKQPKTSRKSLKISDLDDSNGKSRTSLSHHVMDFLGISVKRGFRK